MALYELLYTSAATRPLSNEELVELLNGAREKNSRLGVTGMLVYHDREFMQILEGDKQTVLDLYDVIGADLRHSSPRVFYSGEIANRSFADWTMAFASLNDVEPELLDGFSEFLEKGFTSEAIQDELSTAQRLLQTLRDRFLLAQVG